MTCTVVEEGFTNCDVASAVANQMAETAPYKMDKVRTFAHVLAISNTVVMTVELNAPKSAFNGQDLAQMGKDELAEQMRTADSGMCEIVREAKIAYEMSAESSDGYELYSYIIDEATCDIYGK
ncbi:hypothetical protein [Vibrio harveyi]|uniref:hypothetical protein n=1 Tax=Vibrio harveyi TaxID=669 RepID=UPI003909064B